MNKSLVVAIVAIAVVGAVAAAVLLRGGESPVPAEPVRTPAVPELEIEPAPEPEVEPEVEPEEEPPPGATRPTLPAESLLALAIERTAAYMAPRVLTGDAYWLGSRAAHLLGGEFTDWQDHLTVFVDYDNLRRIGFSAEPMRAWVERYDYDERPAMALPAPEGLTPAPTPHEITLEELERTLRVTVLGFETALDCDAAIIDELLADVSQPGAHYVLTHQLFSLILAYQYECIPQEEYETLRELLATRVLRELLGDERFTDLTAERMALLALAGLPHWIPQRHVDMAIETQLPNGGWPNLPVFAPGGFHEPEPDHHAALAFFALAMVWLDQQES